MLLIQIPFHGEVKRNQNMTKEPCFGAPCRNLTSLLTLSFQKMHICVFLDCFSFMHFWPFPFTFRHFVFRQKQSSRSVLLTLSRWRPLSYRNQNISYRNQKRPVLKELKRCSQKKIYMNHVTPPMSFADISIFSPEISNITKYRQIAFWRIISNSFNFF